MIFAPQETLISGGGPSKIRWILGNRSGHAGENRYPIGPMNRFLTPILFVLLLAGCKSQAPMADPFFGRQTIPPPPTGSINGLCADPYYQTPTAQPSYRAPPQLPGCLPSQPSSVGAATSPPPNPSLPGISTPSNLAPRPSSTAPGGSSTPPPSASSPYSPPGNNFNFRENSTRVPPPSSIGVPISRWVSSSSLEDRMPGPVDDAAVAARNLAGREPIVRTLQPRTRDEAIAGRPVDIMDLPKAP